MKRIILTNSGLTAKVDDEDYLWINEFKWCLSRKSGLCYAVRTTDHEYMHKLVAYRHALVDNAKVRIDHKDRDGLNCQKENIRESTVGQNAANSAGHRDRKKSKYKGVTPKGSGWMAQIQINKIYKYLGTYRTQEEAAKAYNKAAQEYFGEFAYINPVTMEG